MTNQEFAEGSWFRARVCVQNPDSTDLIVGPGQIGKIVGAQIRRDDNGGEHVYEVAFFPSGIVDFWFDYEILDDGELLKANDPAIPSSGAIALTGAFKKLAAAAKRAPAARMLAVDRPFINQMMTELADVAGRDAKEAWRTLGRERATSTGSIRLAREALDALADILGVAVSFDSNLRNEQPATTRSTPQAAEARAGGC